MDDLNYNCPNDTVGTTEVHNWLPFAKLVKASFFNPKKKVVETLKGVFSRDSVIVIPFRRFNNKWQIGIMKEQRLLFRKGWLSAFPAGKVENKSPEETARLENRQELGYHIKQLFLFGIDMPFLHIISEKVHFFIALVEGEQKKQDLEEGERISSEIHWMDWQKFCSAIYDQQMGGPPLLENSPMDGVSLVAANKLLALKFDPFIFWSANLYQ